MTDIMTEYTGESIRHSDGVAYAVLDTSILDFESPEVKFGKKTKPTLIRVARPGEEVITSPGSHEESRTVAQGGEAIFINQLPGGKEDAFIPRDSHGSPNGQQILNDNYEFIYGDVNDTGAMFKPKTSLSRILHEVIIKPSVIKDAWGAGKHQFLREGATLKVEGGRVTGIDKAAFDETWTITNEAGSTEK